jgi:glucose/arabinose dehydrogenase
MHRARLLIATLLCLWLTPVCAASPVLHTQDLTIDGKSWPVAVPEGLRLELLTDKLEAPRLMEFLPNGVLLVGSRSGKVYRLEPPYRQASVLVELEDYPHSLAYREGELLIAQTDGVYRAAFTPDQTSIDWNDVELLAALPTDVSMPHWESAATAPTNTLIRPTRSTTGAAASWYWMKARQVHAGKATQPVCATRSGLTGTLQRTPCMPRTTARITLAMISRPSISPGSHPVHSTACRGTSSTVSRYNAMTA